MSLLDRMRADVGDADPVWRYLAEKVGHTALFAWLLVCLGGVRPLHAALIAALGYVVVGKVIWFASHRTFDVVDFGFDLLVGLLVAIIALPLGYGWTAGALCFLAWCTFVAIGSNNQWGRPS